ncbi:MAG: hypothetical protein QM765_13140 [Myxococcales bacterium]
MTDDGKAQRKRDGLTLGMLFLGVPLALVIVAFVLVDQLARRELRGDLDRRSEEARKALAPFLHERALLAEEPFFRQHAGGDAGPYLNPRLHWDLASTAGELRVDLSILNDLSKLGKDWATKGRGSARPRLDTSWMRRLHGFGYWELTNGGPLASGGTHQALGWPSPSATSLMAWAKLRLMEGLDREGDLAEAVADVRHLAWLVYSTEAYLSRFAADLLSLESRACEVAAAEGRPSAACAPMTRAQLDRFNYVVLQSLALGQAATPPEVFEAAFSAGEDAVGRCSGLLNATERAEALRSIGPGEFRDFIRRVEAEISAGKGCRFAVVRAYRERTDSRRLLDDVLQDPLTLVCKYAPGAYCRSLARIVVARLAPGIEAPPSGLAPSATPDAGR